MARHHIANIPAAENQGVGERGRNRIFRLLIFGQQPTQPNAALLLNQVSSVRDCLLSEIPHGGFRLVNVSMGLPPILAEIRAKVFSLNR